MAHSTERHNRVARRQDLQAAINKIEPDKDDYTPGLITVPTSFGSDEKEIPSEKEISELSDFGRKLQAALSEF